MEKTVIVKLFPGMSEVLGGNMLSVTTRAGTVDELLNCLAARYGKEFTAWVFDEDGEFRDGLLITVNSTAIGNLDGLATVLQDGDVLSIILPVAGG